MADPDDDTFEALKFLLKDCQDAVDRGDPETAAFCLLRFLLGPPTREQVRWLVDTIERNGGVAEFNGYIDYIYKIFGEKRE
jgi:hypothetical protein